MKIALFAHKIQSDKDSIPTVFCRALTPASEINAITLGMHQVKISTG